MTENTQAKSSRGRKRYIEIISRQYQVLDADIQAFFKAVPAILQMNETNEDRGGSSNRIDEQESFELCLAYLFSKLERAHMMALYFACVNILRADTKISEKAINVHLTRDTTKKLLETLYGSAPPETGQDYDLKISEKVRDRLMHGKKVNRKELADALLGCLRYAQELKKWCEKASSIEEEDRSRVYINPFAPDARQIVSGRRGRLSPKISRLVLKGCGFPLS